MLSVLIKLEKYITPASNHSFLVLRLIWGTFEVHNNAASHAVDILR